MNNKSDDMNNKLGSDKSNQKAPDPKLPNPVIKNNPNLINGTPKPIDVSDSRPTPPNAKGYGSF